MNEIGYQMIERLESLHSKGYIHRDLKPENICIGLPPNDGLLYLIDFGMAIQYKDIKINQKNPSSFKGNLGFASLNAHYCIY